MERVVNFGAGRAFDCCGRATPHWTGVVVYQWDAAKQVFHVRSVEILGTGTTMNSHPYEEEMETCEEVNSFLDYFRELENHYKKVYGE